MTGGPRLLARRIGPVARSGARAVVGSVRCLTRRALAVLLLAIVLAGVLVGGVSRVRVDTGAEAFLPAGDPTLAAVQRKARDFGGDPVIAMLRYPAPREFLDDHDQLLALLKTEGQLSKLPDVATVYGPATVLNQITGAAQDFLAQIAGRRDGLRKAAEQTAAQAGRPLAEVTAAGDAAVESFDRRYLPLILKGLPVGLPTLSNARFADSVIFGPGPSAKPEWRFIVPRPDTVVILVRPRQDLDQAGTQRLVTAVRSTIDAAHLATTTVTISGVPAVTAELASEVSGEGPLIGALIALVVLLRFLFVPTPGAGPVHRRDSPWRRLGGRLRPMLASLLGSAATLALFGWLDRPLSFAAVLLLPLLLGVGSSFPLYLATVPNRRRMLVMSVGSALAFLALAWSPLPFVRDLGFALAAGILLTVGAAVGLEACGGGGGGAESTGEPRPARPTAPAAGPGSVDGVPAPARPGLGRVSRHVVLVLVVAAAAVGWIVLPRLTVQANPIELADGLPALTDARVVESVLGASGEVAVRLDGPNVVSSAALSWARAAQRALAAGHADQLRPVVSAASLLSFLGDDPTEEQVSGALAVVPSYLTSSVVRPDHQVALLVYGVRLQDLGAQQRMLDEVRAALPPPPPGYRVGLVGLPVAAARGYQLLLDDRYPANLAGILVAGLALAFGLRRRGDALRAVGAAAVATGWGLAALWLLGVQLSPLTVALGSLVTVTGCEFVVLLAESERVGPGWLRRSVAYACLTSVLGYLVLAVSRLWLVREFGLVLAAAVVLSYLAARLVVRLYPPRARVPAGPSGAEPSSTSAGVEVNA